MRVWCTLLLSLLASLVLACDEGTLDERSAGREPAAPRNDASGGDTTMSDGDIMMGDGGMTGRDGTRHEGGRMMREGGMMMDGDGMMGPDMMTDMPSWMMSRGMRMDGDMMAHMRIIHGLLVQHEAIEREVEDIPGGVRTVTTSDDPEVAALIKKHVWQMKQRLEQGQPIRRMDPLFREIFRHHDAIEMRIEEIPEGLIVTETSDDPEVVALIRQHAHEAVSEFVEEGMSRAMRPTPLPEEVRAP